MYLIRLTIDRMQRGRAANHLLPLIAGFGLAVLLSGCAGGVAASATAGSSIPGLFGASLLDIRSQTDIKLSAANFVTVKTNVAGRCRGFALLGLITIVPPKFNTAMDRLYARAQMQTGKPQTLANVIIEKTSSYWILFSLPQYSVRASVVEFVPEPVSTNVAAPPH
jgi:hypothetical protein